MEQQKRSRLGAAPQEAGPLAGLEGVHVAEEAVGSTGQRFLLRGAVAKWASSPHRRTLD